MEPFDSQITDAVTSLEDHREAMEATTSEIVVAVTRHLQEWAPKEVEAGVKANPERTAEIGIDGLRELKTQLNDLVGQLPERVKVALSADQVWVHRPGYVRQPGREPDYFVYNNQPGSEISGALSPIFDSIVSLMTSKGYRDEYRPQADRFRIRTLTWPDSVLDLVRRYWDQATRLATLVFEVDSLKRQNAQAEAKQLWDDAG